MRILLRVPVSHLHLLVPIRLQHKNDQIRESGNGTARDSAKRSLEVVLAGQRTGDLIQQLDSITTEVCMPS
jgi:hypothetical protein